MSWDCGPRDAWYGRQVLVHAPEMLDDGVIGRVVSGPWIWTGTHHKRGPFYQVVPVGADGGPMHSVEELLPIEDVP